MNYVSDITTTNQIYKNAPRVLIVAPFSLEENWSDQPWPFLKHLRQLFGEENVDFFGQKFKQRWSATKTTLPHVVRRLRKYDVVVAWFDGELMYAVSLIRALSPVCPRVIWLGPVMEQQPPGLKAQLKRQVIKFLMRGTDLIIFNSEGQLELLRQRYPSMTDRSVYVRYTGSRRIPASAYEAAKAEDGGYIFSGGGSNRDYATLLAAVRGLNYPVKLVVPSRDSLGQDLPDHVEVYESIPFEQFSCLLAQSACVVLPLREPNVASGQLVLLQALELGKALIVTDFEGADDYVRDGDDALLVRLGDAEDLKNKLETLLTDRSFRDKIAQNGCLSFQKRFGWESYAEDIARLIQTTVSI